MKIKNVFGVILIILGGYLTLMLYQSSLPIIYGTEVKADIVSIDSVANKRFRFLYYPVLQFNYKNHVIRITDESSSVNKDIINSKIMVYYDEDHGVSQGFTIDKIIFLIISISFLFFGVVSIATPGEKLNRVKK